MKPLAAIIPFTTKLFPSPLGLRFLLSIRGMLFLAISTYLLRAFVAPRNDVIAAELAFVTLAITLALVSASILLGTRNSRRAAAELRGDSGTSFGGLESTLVLDVSDVVVPPFFVLSLAFDPKSGGAGLPVFRLTGSASGKRLHPLVTTFPHRGRWEFKKLYWSFGDQFGLTGMHWESVPGPDSVVLVRPQPAPDRHLPVISSSQRAGDTMVDTRERLGDPFDIKAYHPSDGLRRILWKVYARSGQLLSRHPEPSVVPEGQVIIYVAAGREDDALCSIALGYVMQLEQLNLEVFFGCAGMGDEPIAKLPEDALDLMIDSVWESDHRDIERAGRELTRLIEAVTNVPGARVQKLLVLLSPSQLRMESDRTYFVRLGSLLEARGIAPVFFVLEPGTLPDATVPLNRVLARLPKKLRRMVVIESDTPGRRDLSEYRKFLSDCLSKNWEIVE